MKRQRRGERAGGPGLALVGMVIALSACLPFGESSSDAEDAAAGAPSDTVSAAESPDSGRVEGDASPVADVAVDSVPQEESIETRLDRLLAGQEVLSARIESLSADVGAQTTTADSATAEGGGRVLGEARRQVRGFGVGVFLSVIVLVLFSTLIRGLVWLLDALAERNARRRLFFKRLVPIARIVLWSFAAYLIIRVIFRVDAQGVIAAAAAIGVAVGFAAQDLLKNLFGGLILVFDQPFQVGDKVSIGGTYGEVKTIGLRSTRIVTSDDNLVSVPNAQVVDQQVANANAGELNCQVVTDLYLPGWVDDAAAKKIAFEAAASSKYVYLNKPIVVLVSDVFKETFLTRIRVKAYVLDPRLEFVFQSDVTERARAGFREAGLLRPEDVTTHVVFPRVTEAHTDSGPASVDAGEEA
jgi:small-conductance mechanosensitive channel